MAVLFHTYDGTRPFATEASVFFEREHSQLDMEHIYESWFFSYDQIYFSPLSKIAKRSIDLILSLAGLLFCIPFFILITIAIKLDSRGSIFYKQHRVGKNGHGFNIIKFRSMQPDAEIHGAQWAKNQDPRITRVGRVLRTYRLDELPQLWNILIGQMSLVGPRPERPELITTLLHDIPFFEQRHFMRPGLTGWAQINYSYGASVEDARQKLGYDLYYIKNYSLLLDLVILIKTLKVILWNHGAR